MRKIFYYKKIYTILLIPVILILFLFLDGYRFTSMQAVKSFLNDNKILNVFGEVKRDFGIVYLLETDDGIETIFVEKKWFLWNCSASTYFFDDIIKDDSVKTIGWISVTDNNKNQITVFAVNNTDPNVNFIEAGSNSDKQKKSINLNETIIFLWDKSIGGHELNATAYDNDLQKYKYGYNPENLSVIRSEDLRWYSVN